MCLELVIKGEDKLECRAEKRGRGGPFMRRLTWGWAAPEAGPLAFGSGGATGRPGCTLEEPKF